MKKRVCVFLWNNFTNDSRVRREVSALAEAEYDVTVICTYDGDENKLFATEFFGGSKVIRVWNFKSLYIWLAAQQKVLSWMCNVIIFLDKIKIGRVLDALMIFINMIRYGMKEKYDFYHCNDLKTLPQGFICSKIVRKAKIIYDSHEVETSRAGGKSKVKYMIERFLIHKADRVIMTTDTRAEHNAKLYNIKKPAVIHNYPLYKEIDKTKVNLHKLLGLEPNEPILLYQGGFQTGRGIENIIKAVKHFKRGTVVLIGDGPLKKNLLKLIKEHKVEERVKFVPKVPAKDLLYYTQYAYLGFQVLENTCFNHYSALSNKLLEYIMMEVPVICSALPEMKKIVSNHNIGQVIETSEVDQIVMGVNKMLIDTELYNKAKLNCKAIKKNFIWDNEKQLFIAIYTNLS